MSDLTLSIVIPLYNEESLFSELVQRLEQSLSLLPEKTEILLVNDGSRDATASLIDEQVKRNPKFCGIHLSRNFGHQEAISSGIAEAQGAFVAIIDGDLQDPPEILHEMLEVMLKGYDVVYAIRKNRKEGFIKRKCYKVFYRLLAMFSNIDIPLDSGDFCMMRRNVVDAMNAMPEKNRFVRGLRSYVGFRQVGFEYERHKRFSGEPKYTFIKLLKLAMDGIFSFSEKPLRMATFGGGIAACLSLLVGFYQLIKKIVFDYELPGFASLAVGLFFLGGIQLISVGILGEYIGRIYREVKGRPHSIVARIERSEKR